MFIEPFGPVELVRDTEGWFYHPIFNCCDDNDEVLPQNFFQAFGIETRTVYMDADIDSDTFDDWFELGDPNISLWNPTRPDGDGWFVLVIDDTDNGPRCIWGRDLRNVTFDFAPSGGWCAHGVMEANRCDKCIEELRAAGIEVQWHEGNKEEFKNALEEIFSRSGEGSEIPANDASNQGRRP